MLALATGRGPDRSRRDIACTIAFHRKRMAGNTLPPGIWTTSDDPQAGQAFLLIGFGADLAIIMLRQVSEDEALAIGKPTGTVSWSRCLRTRTSGSLYPTIARSDVVPENLGLISKT